MYLQLDSIHLSVMIRVYLISWYEIQCIFEILYTHIIQKEHTTLCGSEKYPVRDPFFKMLNRSLATFMNAFTGKIESCLFSGY